MLPRAVDLAKEDLAREPAVGGVLRILANDCARLGDYRNALDDPQFARALPEGRQTPQYMCK